VLIFLGGILFVQQMATLPSLAWSVLLMPLAFLAWRWPHLGLPFLFLLSGLLWATFRAGLILAEGLPPELEGRDLRIEGRLADIPVMSEHGLRFLFDVERGSYEEHAVQVPHRIQLSIHGRFPALHVGDLLAFTARLKRPHGFQNPGGFDYEGHLFQQRVRASGYVREIHAVGNASHRPAPVYRLNRLRQQLAENIHALLPSSMFAGMLTAFANGDGNAIPDAQWDVLNRTGTSHLVAISGMNVSLVAGLIFFLLRSVWSLPGVTVLVVPAPRFAAAGALLAAAAYTALAGFAIPTQRALAMLVVVLGGILVGRCTAPSTLLAAALLAVLILDPLSVMAPGFWLSFCAVAVILYVVVQETGGVRERLAAWGRIQWAVFLGLLPVLIFLFQQASLIGPLANLLAIPVVETVVIPATLLGVVSSLVLPDSLAIFPFLLAEKALALLWPALEWSAHLKGALWVQHAPPPWTLITAAIGVMLLLVPRGFPGRWLGSVWLLPMFLIHPPSPRPGEAWFTLLDVGQGLSAVVRTHAHTLVYDTGARLSARFDAGRTVVVPFLRHEGIGHVDTLIVSHGDNDHIGGSASLLAALPVKRILSSVPERLPDSQSCRSGQRWEWDEVQFEILHPDADSPLHGNNLSCVLRVTGPYGRILLPGDIAARGEQTLMLNAGEQLPADVLVVPHHGSKSSSTWAFLEAVRPHVALFPFGYRNRYHHPHPAVVMRYQVRNIRLEDSPTAGAIGIQLEREGLRIQRFREEHRRYWYADTRQ
jgi:competence protein ComEC